MRIDWTQTLLGPDGHSAPEEIVARPILLAGRMAGLLGAVLALAGLVAAMPFARQTGATIEQLTAIAGLLVAQVTAFAVARQAVHRAVPAMVILAGVSLLLLAGLGAGVAVLACTSLLLGAEILAVRKLFGDDRRNARRLLAMGLLAGGLGFFLALPHLTGGVVVASLAVPALAMLPLTLSRGARFEPVAAAAPATLSAMLDVTLSRFPGSVVIVDGAGRIEPAGMHARFSEHLRGQALPSGSLIDGLLVVDRPRLLQALSQAIHDQVSSADLSLRFRDGDPSAPANYRPHAFSIWPVAGLPGRALVMIAPANENRADPVSREPDAALIQRAMHDAVSPFNAGLGYLELIADPRLAPRDLASTRHYAREARAALIEAHRNTALMSRWLKLMALPPAPARERSDLMRAVTDTARLFAGAETLDGEIRIEGAEAGIQVEIGSEILRFAIGVLLRSVLKAGEGAIVSVHASGADAMIVARPGAGGALPSRDDDVFQMALEQAATGFARLRFTERAGERCLTLSGAATLPLQPLKSDMLEPLGRGRLAS